MEKTSAPRGAFGAMARKTGEPPCCREVEIAALARADEFQPTRMADKQEHHGVPRHPPDRVSPGAFVPITRTVPPGVPSVAACHECMSHRTDDEAEGRNEAGRGNSGNLHAAGTDGPGKPRERRHHAVQPAVPGEWRDVPVTDFPSLRKSVAADRKRQPFVDPRRQRRPMRTQGIWRAAQHTTRPSAPA